ncbi:hypothetical protein HK096_005429 [Nowakowskiella sp. JEL0078]|nr:hypothetical protein HK096_005429 [Nowakowskiella sp. JEL0078]
MCSRASENSKYEPMLRSMGINSSEVLYEAAKQNFDHEDISLENLMAVIYMGMYCVKKARLKQYWIYLNMASQLSKFLEINLDPDDLESRYGLQFSMIEKETRRRIWLLLNPMFLKYSLISNLEVTVRKPLPLEIFHALTDNMDTNLCILPINIDINDIEHLTQALDDIMLKIQKSHEKYRNRETSFECHIEANTLYLKLLQWYYSTPEWVQNVLKLENSKIPPSVSYKNSILAIRLITHYHSLILLVYRYSYSSLCRTNPPETCSLTFDSPQMKIEVFQICWNSHHIIVDAFKQHSILFYSAHLEIFANSIMECMFNVALFSCTMLRFSDVQELREIAMNDFKFIKLCIYTNAKFLSVLAQIGLELLDRIDKLPFGLEREILTYQMIGIALEQYEKRIMMIEM